MKGRGLPIIGDAIGGWHAISEDIMAGTITELIGISLGGAEVVGVQFIAWPAEVLDVDSAHSWIRGKGRVSAEARRGSGASRVVKTSCWSARRARGEAQGLMEEAGNGMAHMAPSFVGLSRPRVRADEGGQAMRKGEGLAPHDEWVFRGHACADRVKCTCLTRAPAAEGVLMAFGLSDVLRAMVYLPLADRIALHLK